MTNSTQGLRLLADRSLGITSETLVCGNNSEHTAPTVHNDVLAIHVARGVGAQELDSRAVLVDTGHAPHRDKLRELDHEFFPLTIENTAGR